MYAAFPVELEAIAGAGLPDADGLVGRNATYGRMVSARFQMGSGLSARVAVLGDHGDAASEALRAIEAGFATVDASGEPVSELPPDAPPGASLSEGDRASAASFFLGDACLGLAALRRAPATWGLGDRVEALVPTAALATEWLLSQQSVLEEYDGDAPNRLLFDARAFAACGHFVGDGTALVASDRFVDGALALQRANGSFVEGGGTDTSYQGVAVAIGFDVLVAGTVRCAELVATLRSGARWLAVRVDEEGRVDSSDNTRTCGGGESFLGSPKLLDVAALFRALASVGTALDQPDSRVAAARISAWVQANPGGNPCFPES